jgi:tetraacyldisaccharide 4'-kinase
LIRAASSLYGAATTWRRQWYARHPSRQRHLGRPVVSIGNLTVGGSGKTPVAEYVARLLVEHGERPAILTRGYGRRVSTAGVTVVSDGTTVRATIDTAGDEPLMLAQALAGVSVLVGADRYLSGRLAEDRYGATVHVLDDGFQHLAIARDVDLLLVSEEDLTDLPFPAGRLREPLAAAASADALLVTAGYPAAVERIARALHATTSFGLTRVLGAPRRIASPRDSVVVPPDSRVFALAGIARPTRFFSDVESAGWRVVGTLAFRDHHRFSQRDIRRIARAAKASAAAIVLTTEKDAVRLAACELGDLPIASVPLRATIDPADAFRDWLLARIRDASRTQNRAPRTENPAPRTP